ncbi:unnamed protein product, partial [Iphiclides podalirius]
MRTVQHYQEEIGHKDFKKFSCIEHGILNGLQDLSPAEQVIELRLPFSVSRRREAAVTDDLGRLITTHYYDCTIPGCDTTRRATLYRHPVMALATSPVLCPDSLPMVVR